MKRDEYISGLRRALHPLPVYDREEIVQDVEERFNVGASEGQTDEEIIAQLGSFQDLAHDYLEQEGLKAEPERHESTRSKTSNPTLSVLLIIALIILIWPIFGLFTGMLAMIIAGGALIIGAIALMTTGLVSLGGISLFALSTAQALPIAISLLILGLGFIFLFSGLLRLAARGMRKLINLIVSGLRGDRYA